MHPVCNKVLLQKKSGKAIKIQSIMFGENALLSTTLHILKYSGGCIMLWVCL
jgi:hypothetical protein